jgi:four helix bundle protein
MPIIGTGNIIIDKSFCPTLEVISFTEILEREKQFVIANPLLKSGISIGANIREDQNCESKTDFIHKLKIAVKEAKETEYRLLLCQYSESYPFKSPIRKSQRNSKNSKLRLFQQPKIICNNF